MSVAAAFRGMPAGRVLAARANVADRQRRDRPPEPVIRGKDVVVAVPVFSRWWDEIGAPVEKLKRRQFDHAVGSRPRLLPPASRADSVGGFVPGEHGADFGNAAVFAADHGEPLECEGWPELNTAGDAPSSERSSAHRGR